MMKILYYNTLLFLTIAIGACTQMPTNSINIDKYPAIYPDYINTTIPPNIAPLNFLLREECEASEVKIIGLKDSILIHSKNNIQIPLNDWKEMIKQSRGQKLLIRISAKINRKWFTYKPFYWQVVGDSIDPFLSYRLIEPGYEVWSDIRICERNLSNYQEKTLADNNQLDNACMNCHIYGNQKGDLSMFHLRGKQGGTILNRNGQIRKLKLKTDNMKAGAVYGAFHASGRYAVFSTNIIIPEFHTFLNKRMEVYDTISDLIVCDFDRNRIFSSKLISRNDRLETFPVFSPDGKYIYFCSAPKGQLPKEIKKTKYSLYRISFNPDNRTFGNKIDTIWNADKIGKSVSFPKISPDGKYILFTISDYGTFPIWHQEADLCMIKLDELKQINLHDINSNRSDTYHSWSSNSRWFVFASKRGDGQYGKPYFSYVDAKGNVYKPFVLPQEDPTHYDDFLYSYNIPELSATPVIFNNAEIEQVYHSKTAETFRAQ